MRPQIRASKGVFIFGASPAGCKSFHPFYRIRTTHGKSGRKPIGAAPLPMPPDKSFLGQAVATSHKV